jgi:hypothetical protein
MEVELIIGIVLVPAAGVLVWLGMRQHKIYSRVKNTPTSNISDLYEGPAEVNGSVVPLSDTLESPLTRKPCVAFRFIVEEERTRRDKEGRTSKSWHTIINDKQSVIFGVDDGTGIAAIDLQKAQLILDQDSRMRSGFFDEAPSHVETLLREQYGRSTKNWVFNKSLRYKEFILEAGDPLYVLGNVRRNSPGDAPMFYKGDIPFIVSDKGEKAVLSRMLWTAIGFFAGSLGTLVGAAFLIQQGVSNSGG